jgi:AGZA family xanthine/uracil permease-like MFS transporter
LTGRVEFNGFISSPPSLAPIFLELDIIGAFDIAMISVVMSFLFVNFFDTTGTLLGVANQTKLTDKSGNTYNLKQALNADSSSSFIGTFFGCSPVTSYVESTSGVEAGGRTGLTAVVVGILFLLATFFSPIASIIPPYATAGALIYVAMLMFFAIRLFDWSDVTEVIPCLLTIIIIPLTFSIANGIALGFISYILIKILTGKSSDLNLGLILLGVIFGLKFLFL